MIYIESELTPEPECTSGSFEPGAVAVVCKWQGRLHSSFRYRHEKAKRIAQHTRPISGGLMQRSL